MDPQSFLGIDPEILRRLAAAKLYGPAVRGTLPPDPAYGPVPPSQRPAMGSYMAAPMPAMPTEPPMKPPVPVTVPAPTPGARAAGVPSAPPPTAAAPPAGLLSPPQPVSPMVGAPQAISPLLGGGALPELPAGGMAAAGDESGGFLDWLAKPELASALMEMGARMLAASAPSTNPASGSLGYALGQGVGGFGAGMDKAREQKRQERNDAVNEAYKAAMIDSLSQPETPKIETFYDPATGTERKGWYDLASGEINWVGGAKAPPRGAGGGGGTPGSPWKNGIPPAGVVDEILAADAMAVTVASALSSLEQAEALNEKAYEGVEGDFMPWFARNVLGGTEAATATTQLKSIMTEQALSQLRAIFGGNPTEGERKILLDIQASASMSKEERAALLARAKEMARIRLAQAQSKAQSLRTGDFLTAPSYGTLSEGGDGSAEPPPGFVPVK